MKLFLAFILPALAFSNPADQAHQASPPAYHAAVPAYGHASNTYAYAHQPAYGYAYQQPQYNCSVVNETSSEKVCVPTLAQVCSPVDVTFKVVVPGQYCYEHTTTVCTTTTELVDNEVCTYSYEKKCQKLPAQTLKVAFKQQCKHDYVTVCEKGYGYQQHCKQVPQESCFNSPVVQPNEVEVEVCSPSPVKSCTNHQIELPKVECSPVTEQRCVQIPVLEDRTESVEKCEQVIGQPQCSDVKLTLPKQVCIAKYAPSVYG